MPPKTYLVSEAYLRAHIDRHCGPMPYHLLRQRAKVLMKMRAFPRAYYTPAQREELVRYAHDYERRLVDEFLERHGNDYLKRNGYWKRD